MRVRLSSAVGILSVALASCGAGAIDAGAKVGAHSPFFAAFDSGAAAERHAQGLTDVRETIHRTGVVITPPGDAFNDFRLTANLTPEQVDKLLADIREDIGAELRSTKSSWDSVWRPVDARPHSIVRATLGDAERVQGSFTEYPLGQRARRGRGDGRTVRRRARAGLEDHVRRSRIGPTLTACRSEVVTRRTRSGTAPP